MYRRLLPLTALITAIAAAVSSCSLVDVLGPRPDADLLELAEQALKDERSAAETDPELAELRGNQAEELLAEITRLCGTDPAGKLPSTCEVTEQNLDLSDQANSPAADIPAQALSQVLTAVEDVPEDSVDLLTVQAVELATADGDTRLPEPPVISDEEDLAAARTLLEEEYAIEYGLGVAAAFVAAGDAALLEDTLAATRERILALQLLLQPSDDVPSAQPGYEFTAAPAPVDEASTEDFLTAVRTEEGARWEVAAATAQSLEWRDFAVAAAAHAGAGQLPAA